jgi:hypothetical protein
MPIDRTKSLSSAHDGRRLYPRVGAKRVEIWDSRR